MALALWVAALGLGMRGRHFPSVLLERSGARWVRLGPRAYERQPRARSSRLHHGEAFPTPPRKNWRKGAAAPGTSPVPGGNPEFKAQNPSLWGRRPGAEETPGQTGGRGSDWCVNTGDRGFSFPLWIQKPDWMIQLLFIKHLLYTSSWFRSWGLSGEQNNQNLLTHGAGIPVESWINKQMNQVILEVDKARAPG